MKTPQIPIPKLAAALNISNEVWLKREDKHKYGSHKGRSIPLMIDAAYEAGKTHFAISSSGNAALAAARAVNSYNRNNKGDKISLTILVGQHITDEKLENIKKEMISDHITLQQVNNPKQQAIQMENSDKAVNLRQSTNDIALIGYEDLASELAKIEGLSAVFVPTSSGTTAQGLYEGFQKRGVNPEIHIVQTTSCHPIVDTLTGAHRTATPPNLPLVRGGSNTSPSPLLRKEGGTVSTAHRNGVQGELEQSLATAIVDKVAHRKEKVVEAIQNSHGNGWIATNEDILKAIELVKQTSDLAISPNAALSVVGLMQAVKKGKTWSGPVVCLVTGL